ncbi:hypothetical protein PVK06_034718 [Gossypium arboreum]|uniref:Disease resistance protein RGA3 n=1 Tax=Gossypium arboreum TaxID=29729 RepID=A0ABR0NF15_GOSAR|nr:hypothetical protein PVK06_034718 [Gossypium arboreum]
MAEGILFNLAGDVVEGLASLAAQELGVAWGFKDEINKLSKTASVIRAVLRDAEDHRNHNNHQLTLWLKELKDVLYDVEDLLDDFSTEALRRKLVAGNDTVKEVRLFFSKSNQLAYSLKMGHKVKALRERLDAIVADRANFHLTNHPLELPIEVRERDQTHSFVRAQEIIGRDYDKKKIVKLLLESKAKENVSIVPIVGIGGLGKTTLAKMLFNDENVVKHFELKMWVCVSEKFELKVIVQNISEAATESKPDKELQMQTLQNRLRDNIDGKKYLLVLDDVWNDDLEKWHSLKTLLLDGAKGSWIVVTTRSEAVARITGTVSSHLLRGLSRSESWSLLKQMACKEESLESNGSRLKAIGMEIADKCGGVPLALRAIGRVLYKKAEVEWVKVKDNVHKYIARPESGILPILKLSYDHLPPHLKQCFAYCSLIPKDTKFGVKRLIRYWMAQGFIQPTSGNDGDLEDVGHEYFKDLLWRYFFQADEEDEDSGNVECFIMHDLMHDLACSVAATECCVASLEAENVNERTRHASFEDRLYFSHGIPTTLLKATRVRSFIQINSGHMDLSFNQKKGGHMGQSTCSALISNFKYLRNLDLSSLAIKKLPHSIGELKHLRDLDLSGNRDIRKLPGSLCRLQNLQTLDLFGCWSLENLPSKTSRLVSLMHLNIRQCTNLCYMPRGLGKLTCLQTLCKFVVGKKKGREVCGLRELQGLNNLKGELGVSCLENAGIPELGSTYLKDKLNLKSLEFKWSRWSWTRREDEMVLECLQPPPNLEILKVEGYAGTKLSSWLSSMTMMNVTQLTLKNCTKCKHLPPLHRLSSLKLLKLSRLVALENVSETEMQKELFSAKPTTIFFPSLEELWIRDCPNLKGWWRPGDVGEASNAQRPCFPCLSELHIYMCPNLTSMPLFPSIETLYLKETRWKPLIQPTIKMKSATLKLAPSSSCSIFTPFCKLETLWLKDMEELDSLPDEFLQNLTSLWDLRIERCFNLTSMPEGMHCLTSLKHLKISTCPQLRERCRRDIGADWPNISHIQRISIDSTWFNRVRREGNSNGFQEIWQPNSADNGERNTSAASCVNSSSIED